MLRTTALAVTCLTVAAPAIAQPQVFDKRTFHEQFVPPRPKTPLRLVFDDLIESSRTWWLLASDELDQEFERWEATLDPDLVARINAGTLPEDADPHTPIFDSTWWPAALAELGYPRPNDLDERTREPWEYANEIQRLIWEQQRPPAGAEDRWLHVSQLVNTARSSFTHNTQWLYGPEGDALEGHWQDADERVNRFTTDEQARRAREEHPAGIDRIQGVFDAVERDTAWFLSRLVDHEGPAHFAIPVGPVVTNTSGFSHVAHNSVSDLCRYTIGFARDLVLAGDIDEGAEQFHAVSVITTAHMHVPNVLVYAVATRSQLNNASRAPEPHIGRTLTPKQLDAFETAFRAYDPPPFVYAIRGERLTALAQTDEHYEQDRAKIPATVPLRAAARALSADLALSSSRAVQHRLVGILFDAEITLYDPASTEAQRARAEAVLDWYADYEEPEWGDRLPMPASLMPLLSRPYDESRVARARTNALLTMIAIERHRLEHGAIPATLAELTAAGIVSDPFHPEGAPFGYIVDAPVAGTDDGFGTGYRLYTVGADAQDNRAREKTDDRRDALRPVEGHEGFDYVFNRTLD